MRSYPRNSPEAAARIVALVLISDGNVCRTEIEALQRLEVERELGQHLRIAVPAAVEKEWAGTSFLRSGHRAAPVVNRPARRCPPPARRGHAGCKAAPCPCHGSRVART